MILTVLAVILRVLSNPVANVFQKQLTNRNNHPLLVNFNGSPGSGNIIIYLEIYGIKGIEKKMRVVLGFQIIEFCFQLLAFNLFN